MTIRKITFLIATLSAFQANADAFKKALLEAYQNNPDYAAALADFEIQALAESKALSEFLPNAGVNAAINNQASSGGGVQQLYQGFGLTVPPGPLKETGAYNYGANLKWNLFKGFSSLANLTAANYSVLAAAADLNNNEAGLLLNAINAYMDCLTKQKNLESYIASEQSYSNIYEAAKTRFQVGEFTRTDVLSAQTNFEAAKAKRISGEGDLEVSRAQYQKIIGSAPMHLHLPDMIKETLPKTLEEAIELSLAKNPALIKAQFTERAISQGWINAAAAFLPTIDLSASTNIANTNEFTDQAYAGGQTLQTTTYGVSVNFTAFDGFQSSTNAVETSERIQKAKMQLESARRLAIESATKNWSALLAARAEIKVQKSAIESSRIGLEGVRQGARLGANSLLQVLDMEDKHLQAQMGLATAQQKEVVAVYNLLAATGTLSAKDLGLLDGIKDEGAAEVKPAVAVKKQKADVVEVKKPLKKKKKAKVAKKADATKVVTPVAAPIAAPVAAPADVAPKA